MLNYKKRNNKAAPEGAARYSVMDRPVGLSEYLYPVIRWYPVEMYGPRTRVSSLVLMVAAGVLGLLDEHLN